MQIASVQQLMRMELRAPSIGSVDTAWRWYVDGLRTLLPAAIRNWRWRPKALLIEQGGANGPDLRRIVEHSWLGAARLVAGNDPPGLPAFVALAGEKIYRTHLSLPSEAVQTLQKTVALRLDELSPIPPEDAAFALGGTTKQSDGRINVEIAIVKKKTLADAQECYGDALSTIIGANPNDNGVLRFVFREDKATRRANLRPLISAALLIAAVWFFSLSIDVHLSRRLQNLEQHEAAVLSGLRDSRPALALFDGADAATLTKMRGEPASDIIGAMQNALAALPAESRVESINVNDSDVQISGYLPVSKPEDASDPENLQRSASNRPGFDRFSYQAGTEILP